MEGLSLLFEKATLLERVSGFRVSSSAIPIAHLHYADDTILFLNADAEEIEYSLSILKGFELVSGLRINLLKTKLIAVGDVPLLSLWASSLGCGTDTLPTTYLGLPLGASHRAKETWDPVLNRVEQRLSQWKGRLLSKGGRLTLIKSTLSNMPIYYLSVFLAPIKVINSIEKKIRKFLWLQNGGKRKAYHLVNWSKCCTSKESGGLGIKQLRWMNSALLSKWVWRYGIDIDSLWHQVIVAKFGHASTNWWPKKSYLAQGVGCWQRILKGAANTHSYIRYRVHSGTQVRLWLDNWIDGGTLASMYPHLFALFSQKYAPIHEFVSSSQPTEWVFRFRRQLTLDEEEDLHIIKAIIGPTSILSTGEDERIWIGATNNNFSVKSCYDSFTQIARRPYPAKFIWNNRVPSKVGFFLWTASANRCLTLDNLQKRGRHVHNLCLLCFEVAESIDHLLLHCPVAWAIWSTFIPLQISWITPPNLLQLAFTWKGLPLWSAQAKYIWSILPAAICWSIWLERNARVYRAKEATVEDICNKIRGLLLS